jgi:thiamine biosynthesis lipoprotein
MKTIEQERELLGTRIVLKVRAWDERRVLPKMTLAFKEVERIDQTFSRFRQGNALAMLNSKVGEWVTVSRELLELLSFADRVRERTEGAFDVTVKSLLDGWGYNAEYSLQEQAPGQLGRVEFGEGRQVRISAEVDLGGLGKGYAIDRMVAILEGIPNLCVDAGGDIFARGEAEDGKPWKIVFEHPADSSLAIGEVQVDGFALASSSPLRRKWRDRHHLVDPQRGLPAENMLAVYTQAPAALIADTYSTALFALGFDRAQAILPRLPVDALLISPNGDAVKSPGFQGEMYG